MHAQHTPGPGSDMRTDTVYLITFGKGGHSMKGRDYSGCRFDLSGYEDPNSFEARGMAFYPGYVLRDGRVPVVDMRRAVETKTGFHWAFSCPLVSLDDNVERCPEPSPIMASAMADNQYGAFLALHASHCANSAEPGPLDSVPIAQWVDGWKAHGARVGTYDGHTFTWED